MFAQRGGPKFGVTSPNSNGCGYFESELRHNLHRENIRQRFGIRSMHGRWLDRPPLDPSPLGHPSFNYLTCFQRLPPYFDGSVSSRTARYVGGCETATRKLLVQAGGFGGD